MLALDKIYEKEKLSEEIIIDDDEDDFEDEKKAKKAKVVKKPKELPPDPNLAMPVSQKRMTSASSSQGRRPLKKVKLADQVQNSSGIQYVSANEAMDLLRNGSD